MKSVSRVAWPAPDEKTAKTGALLARQAQAGYPDAVSLLRRIVATESHVSQVDGVNAVGRALAGELVRLGFQPERRLAALPADLDEWLVQVMLPELPASLPDVLVFSRAGSGAPVLLLGDLDTAFLPGASERFGYREDGDLAYGPGIADMKAGLVVLLLALRALSDSGLPAPPLRIVLCSDEQAGSLASRAVIREQAAGCQYCLTFECARDGGNLMRARAGVGLALVEVQGREAHAGTSRAAGRSAISGFARLAGPVEALSDERLGRLVTITQVRGGWRRSVVPPLCSFVVDIRATADDVWADTEAALRGVVTESLRGDGLSALVHAAQHRPALLPTPATGALTGLAATAGSALGLDFGFVGSWAAGSSAFAAAIPVLDGMGPPGGDLMTEREHVFLPGLWQRAALVALLLAMSAAGSGAPGDACGEQPATARPTARRTDSRAEKRSAEGTDR